MPLIAFYLPVNKESSILSEKAYYFYAKDTPVIPYCFFPFTFRMPGYRPAARQISTRGLFGR
jgi:hypothetical protein